MDHSLIELHDLDLNTFIKALDKCKGDVFLVSDEGDCLNLRSKLCQFAGIKNLIEGGRLAEASIRCTNPEDETMLFRLNLYGERKED